MAPGSAYFSKLAERPLSTTPPPSCPPYTGSSPTRPTFYPSSDRYSGFFSKQAQKYTRMPAELPLPVSAPTWLSGLRSALRVLIVVLSGAVAGTLVHTLEIYRGNISLDLRNGELPMTWPARTNLVPTLILFAIAAANFFASVAIMVMGFKRSFRRPIRTRDMYRVVAGSFGVVLWITAIIVFYFFDKSSRASLGRYACTNKNVMSNGRYQYRAVCSEQVRPSQPLPCRHAPKMLQC